MEQENANSYCVDCKRTFTPEDLAKLLKGGEHKGYDAEKGIHIILCSECA